MTNKNKTSSDASTSRSHQKRKVTYTPPSYLDAPKPNVDGVKYRWLRVSTGGEDDARNIAKRKREGYEFVKKEEHPDFDVPVHESGKYAGVIGSGDLVLAKISEEMADAKKEYFEKLSLINSYLQNLYQIPQHLILLYHFFLFHF